MSRRSCWCSRVRVLAQLISSCGVATELSVHARPCSSSVNIVLRCRDDHLFVFFFLLLLFECGLQILCFPRVFVGKTQPYFGGVFCPKSSCVLLSKTLGETRNLDSRKVLLRKIPAPRAYVVPLRVAFYVYMLRFPFTLYVYVYVYV